jgi:hypothetical protein
VPSLELMAERLLLESYCGAGQSVPEALCWPPLTSVGISHCPVLGSTQVFRARGSWGEEFAERDVPARHPPCYTQLRDTLHLEVMLTENLNSNGGHHRLGSFSVELAGDRRE